MRVPRPPIDSQETENGITRCKPSVEDNEICERGAACYHSPSAHRKNESTKNCVLSILQQFLQLYGEVGSRLGC